MKKRKISALCLAGVVLFSGLMGYTNKDKIQNITSDLQETNIVMAAETNNTSTDQTITVPKYVFLFIGDGMSYPQIQSAADYIGTTKKNGSIRSQPLSFMKFPVAGSAQTFDSTSFCPDSASTATSIATGNKTYSGTINMNTSMTIPFETIAEKLKEQKDYKIGVLSTVNLNHATPAAFYAHQASRNNYYEIGLELIDSKFDYFAGGALLSPTGKEENQTDLYELAKKAGYHVVTTQNQVEKLDRTSGKCLVVAETLADADAMSYSLDRKKTEWALADYVEKGIEVLDNEKGFFMMVEGGKIDWACHANDAGSSINDTIALSNAVEKAVEFYKKHPQETLILVTGDHETGGLTIGYAGTNYNTYLTNLENQTISYAKFDSDYVSSYKTNQTSFEQVLKDIKENFGLLTSDDKEAGKNPNLVLTEYEYKVLKTAYERTLKTGSSSQSDMTQRQYELYGTYEPLTVTVTHILNNKSGIAFTSYSHTGLPVPVFAQGANATQFEGYYDNTDIYNKLATMLQVK